MADGGGILTGAFHLVFGKPGGRRKPSETASATPAPTPSASQPAQPAPAPQPAPARVAEASPAPAPEPTPASEPAPAPTAEAPAPVEAAPEPAPAPTAEAPAPEPAPPPSEPAPEQTAPTAEVQPEPTPPEPAPAPEPAPSPEPTVNETPAPTPIPDPVIVAPIPAPPSAPTADDHLSPHFKIGEFIASATAQEKHINNMPPPDILEHLKVAAAGMEKVREILGGKPIKISSGFRCHELNTAIGGSATSDHMEGYSVDFRCDSFGTPFEIATKLKETPGFCEMIDQMIFEKSRWVHVSFAPKNRKMILTAYEKPEEGHKTFYAEDLKPLNEHGHLVGPV